jgi:hypothetical protein
VARGQTIFNYFLLLFLVLLGNSWHDNAHPHTALTKTVYAYSSVSHADDNDVVSLKKQTFSQNKIKVRYKGGECPALKLEYFGYKESVTFVDVVNAIHRAHFVVLDCYLHAVSRGPPTKLA